MSSGVLDGEIQSLTGEVEGLMAGSALNLVAAAALLERLRSCQDRAQHAGLASGARQLRTAANQLAIRINLESEN